MGVKVEKTGKNVLAIDCGNTLFYNFFSVLRTQLSKKVKITSENHENLFLLSSKLVKKI